MKILRHGGRIIFVGDHLNYPGLESVPEPTVTQLAANFAGAMARFTAAGFPVVTQAEYDSRAAACNTCQYWDPAAYLGLGKCRHCGCTRFKRWLATETCKAGKWPKERLNQGSRQAGFKRLSARLHEALKFANLCQLFANLAALYTEPFWLKVFSLH